MGDFLPGAVDALYELDRLGNVVIHSCRVAPFEFHEPGRQIVWRDEEVTAAEIRWVKSKLESIGLDHIEVWTRPYKPPALIYIDDKGWRFDGNWPETVDFVRALVAGTERVTFGQNVSVNAADSDAKVVTFDATKPCCAGCTMCEAEVPPDDEVYGVEPEDAERIRRIAAWVNAAYPMGTFDDDPVQAETFIGIDEYEFEQRVTDDTTGGQKGRKLARFALIPWEFTRALARHFGIGALKYDDNNWRRGYDWDLSIDALERHFNAWKGGESVYTERFTGRDGKDYAVQTHHLIAVAWQACVLYIFERLGLGRDTRQS